MKIKATKETVFVLKLTAREAAALYNSINLSDARRNSPEGRGEEAGDLASRIEDTLANLLDDHGVTV